MSDTVTDKATPRAWVGCLACYNEGRLVGAWVDGIEANTARPCPNPTHEERHVFDHEGFGDALKGECGPYEAQAIAEVLRDLDSEQDGDALRAYAANMGEDLVMWQSWEEHARDCFRGTFSDFLDYAEQYIDDSGMMDGWPQEARNYFDVQAFARDLAHDYWTWDAPNGGVFVFWDN